MSTTPVRRSGRGWITFAGILLMVAGVMDFLNGLWALDAQDTAIDALFWNDNIEAWGWFYMIVGAGLATTGAFLFKRAGWALATAVAIACFGAIANLFWLFTYPLASILLITLNLLVVYGLTTYGVDEI
jgi:hypothetical protein